MLKIYHNPRCSKSREVLALLREKGLTPTVIEYLKTPLDVAELRKLLALAQLTPREAMRIREKEYQELGLDNAELTEDDLLAAIAEHPRLLNRPFVVTEKGARLCRSEERRVGKECRTRRWT